MSDDNSGHWWNNGPLAQFRNNHPGAYQGMRAGSVAGPAGSAAGYVIGSIADWFSNRNRNQPIANPGMDRQVDQTAAGINWDPYSGIQTDVGPPAMQQPDDTSGQAPAWWEDTSHGAADQLGLVPDYSGGGGDNQGDGTGGMESNRGNYQGGGMGGGWNNASSNMLSDFSATTNGDYMQRIGLDPKRYSGSTGAKAK